jgi:alpha-L-rhamnosidase
VRTRRPTSRALGIAIAGALVAVSCSTSHPGAMHVVPGAPIHLTVDGLATPIGIDDAAPRFSWWMQDWLPGSLQGAYRIVVRRGSTTVWDSGRVTSRQQSDVSYGGPRLAPDQRYSWSVQTWDAQGRAGALSHPSTFDTGLAIHDWVAQWIRRAQKTPLDATDEYTYARKDVRLAASPIVRATAFVSVGQQYQLHVDGSIVGTGQAFSYPDAQHYEATDLTHALKPGTDNAIGLLYHWYGLGKGRPDEPAAAIAQISVWHADGTHETIATDGTWKVARAPWLASTPRNLQGDPVDVTEHIDGEHEPVGWDRAGFDDHAWSAATVIGRPPVAPWTSLTSAHPPIVYEPVTARSLRRLADGSYVADFGAVYAAVPTVRFSHGAAGHVVRLHAGYALDPDGSVSTTHDVQATDMSYSYVERAGAQTFRSFDYLGFQYLQIDAPGESLSPADVVALARHAQMPDEPAATFTSSDAALDRVWAVAARSALYTSQEQFIDTPTREKGPFLRDGFNESEADMIAFGEQALTRRALLDFAASQARYWPDGRINAIYPSGQGQRDIPDFTEIYPEWVRQYELATGDRTLLEQVYPALTKIGDYLARAENPANSLITDLPGGGDGDYAHGIVDWPQPMRYGYDMSTAARTTVNALAVGAFQDIADLGNDLGGVTATVRQDDRRANALRDAMFTHLMRPDGRFVDGLEADGRQSPHTSEHATAEALAYQIVPIGRLSAADGAYVSRLGIQMGPMTGQLLLDGLHAAGRDADLVRLVTDPRQPGWGHVVATGGTFLWETWLPSDADGDSTSHGWGSSVLASLEQDLVGAAITAPGAQRVALRPPTDGAGLSYLRATLPTAAGPLSVAWQFADHGHHVALDVTVPANVQVVVQLPGQRARTIGSGRHHLAA